MLIHKMNMVLQGGGWYFPATVVLPRGFQTAPYWKSAVRGESAARGESARVRISDHSSDFLQCMSLT